VIGVEVGRIGKASDFIDLEGAVFWELSRDCCFRD
jgi:hypothetical protein